MSRPVSSKAERTLADLAELLSTGRPIATTTCVWGGLLVAFSGLLRALRCWYGSGRAAVSAERAGVSPGDLGNDVCGAGYKVDRGPKCHNHGDCAESADSPEQEQALNGEEGDW